MADQNTDALFADGEPIYIDEAWLDTVVVVGLTCFVLCLMNLSTVSQVCFVISSLRMPMMEFNLLPFVENSNS